MDAFPESIFTERLALRCYTPDRAAALLELVQRNRTMLQTSFAPMAQQLMQLTDTIEFIQAGRQNWRQGVLYQYGIHRRTDDRLIGQIKIKNIDRAQLTFELSYFIDQSCLRQGFASESITAIMQLAFDRLQFNKINLRIVAGNTASLQMAFRLGFVEEKICEDDFVCGDGLLHDVHYLRLLRLQIPAATLASGS